MLTSGRFNAGSLIVLETLILLLGNLIDAVGSTPFEWESSDNDQVRWMNGCDFDIQVIETKRGLTVNDV